VDDIFDLSPDLLCVAGLDGRFKRVNPAYEHTLGYAVDELVSRPSLELAHPDDRERTARMVAGLSAAPHVTGFENRCIRSDGSVRWLQWNARMVPDTGLIYGAGRDVTEARVLTDELAASRRRIVAAADEARRRIERDLHDGAQQRLVGTVIMLKMLRKKLGDADGPVAELVEDALASAQRGSDEVRELARGIHPRILSCGGLGPALRTLASRSSEALANAAKHAHASEVRVTVDVDDRRAVVTVSDDGVGGADPSGGSGLIGLQDRVAALGGSLRVASEPGTGTVVTAQIPVAAPAPGAGA